MISCPGSLGLGLATTESNATDLHTRTCEEVRASYNCAISLDPNIINNWGSTHVNKHELVTAVAEREQT